MPSSTVPPRLHPWFLCLEKRIVCRHIYIYIYREREREIDRYRHLAVFVFGKALRGCALRANQKNEYIYEKCPTCKNTSGLCPTCKPKQRTKKSALRAKTLRGRTQTINPHAGVCEINTHLDGAGVLNV